MLGLQAALTIMSVMVSMVWLMTSSASRLCPQSAAVKLRRYVWSVAMMLRRGSCHGCNQNEGERQRQWEHQALPSSTPLEPQSLGLCPYPLPL